MNKTEDESPKRKPQCEQNEKLAPLENMTLLGRAALGLIYPRRCPFCDEVIGTQQECTACAPAAAALRLAHMRLDPATHYFGPTEEAFAVYSYSGTVRAAILRMKYSGCRWYAPELGNRMAAELFGCTFTTKYGILLPVRVPWGSIGFDAVIPVPPSHFGRGYNVPLLLARPLARALGARLQPAALRRIRSEKHQAGLALDERLTNVAGAFAATKSCNVEGLRILLVDDVITTGATVAACAAALMAKGAMSVSAAALASSQWQQDLRESV